MISIFPHYDETLVVPYRKEEIATRIHSELEATLRSSPMTNFSGWIDEDRFELTIRLRRQHAFMPVIKGVIEPTSKGSIIFLSYKLFPATRLLMLFWTLVLPLTGVLISVQYKNYYVLAGGMAALILIYAVAWSNFRLHLKRTREILLAVLN